MKENVVFVEGKKENNRENKNEQMIGRKTK
jgi:hypothetical protein